MMRGNYYEEKGVKNGDHLKPEICISMGKSVILKKGLVNP